MRATTFDGPVGMLVTLARLEDHANFVHAGGDAALGRSGAAAGRGESTGCACESEMRGVGYAGDGEGAVVSGDADACVGDELASDEAVRGRGLNRRGGRGGGASTGCGQAEGASNVG